ncbi:MAG TPA: FAD-binding oxidoreductase [Longimicrobiales bacterium]
MRDRLTAIVGEAGIVAPEAAARWAVHGIVPRAVVAPATDEEAAAVMALAAAEGWAVEPAGAGVWLDAGRRPERVDLVVTTARMDAAVDHAPADLVATAAAGVRLGTLAARLAPHRQWLPLDPPGHADATLGAVASLAASGPLREGHGTPRDHVLGLRLVTGDGRILDLGGRVVKNVAGYDLVRLVVGSRGTLGLITRLHLRLRPAPERDATLTVPAVAFAPLVELAGRIREERIETAALEIVSGADAWTAAGESRRAGSVRAGSGGEAHLDAPALPWTLLVRLQGNAAAVAEAEARVRRLASEGGLGVAGEAVATAAPRRGPDPAGRHAAGRRDDGAAPWAALGAQEAGAGLSVRLADAPARLGETLRLAVELAGTAADAAAGTAGGAARGRAHAGGTPGAAILAHAGAGIVRVCAPAPAIIAADAARRAALHGAGAEGESAPHAAADAILDRCASALRDARAALAESGGTLTVARAPAALLERFEPFADPGPALRLMKALKSKFDPAGVLSPGRFVV